MKTLKPLTLILFALTIVSANAGTYTKRVLIDYKAISENGANNHFPINGELIIQRMPIRFIVSPSLGFMAKHSHNPLSPQRQTLGQAHCG